LPTAYVFRPDFDLPTKYMNAWLGQAINDVRAEGFTVIDSSGPYATQYNFFDTLERYNPELIIADGHGSPYSLTGQAVQEVLRTCTNNQVLSGKTFCAVSCLTGQVLGPDSRNKTTRHYIGWVNEFTWIVSPPYNPLTDPAAYSFKEVIRSLIRHTCKLNLNKITLKQLYDGVMAEFQKHEDYYSSPPGSEDPYATDILISLRHDKKGLITLGEEGAVYAAPVTPAIPIAQLILGLLGSFPFYL